MERVEFVRSRAKNTGLLFLGLLLVAGGLFMAVGGDEPSERWLGWLCVAFFGLGMAVAAYNIVRGGTAFTFDLGGITDHGHNVVIPWHEVEECAVVSIHGTRFLGLSFRHPDQFLARKSGAHRKLARWNQRMGWGHWGLSFSGISPSIDAAVRFIQQNVSSVRMEKA